MSETNTRVIKRYANRKLYDTLESRYVTLDQISEMIRRGEEVKVIDNNSKDDLTSVTLAQIIFEEEKKQRSFLPLSALRNIIQSGGESLHDLMNSIEKVGHIFRQEPKTEGEEGEEGQPASSDPVKMFREFKDSVQAAVDEWQKRFDSNLQTALDSVSPFSSLHKELVGLGERIAELERKLTHLESSPE